MTTLDQAVLRLPFRGTLTARGLPLAFRNYRVWPRAGGAPVAVGLGVPEEGDVVEPL